MNTNFTNLSNHIQQQQESINSLSDRLSCTIPSISSSNFENSPSGAKRINVCFHCAKPNHSFNECKSASPTDKNTISNSLVEKKFDFVKLRERANALALSKQNRFNIEPNCTTLNSMSQNQYGSC